jgi:23S rRNA (guanosine2251-2'-O)-methyltransferase
MAAMRSPRDVHITLYGRMPVLEALRDPSIPVAKVIVAHGAEGANLAAILEAAAGRGVRVHRASSRRIKLLAGNGRHDQGVVADVLAPRMERLEDYLERDGSSAGASSARLLVLDGITNPANVGLILRTVTAAGLEGVVLPRAGAPEVDPLVVKASAGTAFRAPLLRCDTALEALGQLVEAGLPVIGLEGPAGRSLYQVELPDRAAYVLGSETAGISPACRELVREWISIPLSGGVESLNVATAAAVLAYELVRRRLASAAGSPSP